MNLNDRIDELYRLPLREFTAARNALAKTLTGADIKRVRALPKPTLVPWAVNQLFWNARAVYERLLKSGEALRKAQIAALNGHARNKPADVKRAADSHRTALAEAVRQATRLAEAEGAHLDADVLSRTLESLSLAATRQEHPGRLTELVRPAGFEALAGVSPSAKYVVSAFRRTNEPSAFRRTDEPSAFRRTNEPTEGRTDEVVSAFRRTDDAKRAREEAAAERLREQEQAAKRRQAEAALKAAERALEQATAAEAKARQACDDAEREREAAKARLAEARKFLTSNF